MDIVLSWPHHIFMVIMREIKLWSGMRREKEGEVLTFDHRQDLNQLSSWSGKEESSVSQLDDADFGKILILFHEILLNESVG